jgi:hypothetical protein
MKNILMVVTARDIRAGDTIIGKGIVKDSIILDLQPREVEPTIVFFLEDDWKWQTWETELVRIVRTVQ